VNAQQLIGVWLSMLVDWQEFFYFLFIVGFAFGSVRLVVSLVKGSRR